MSDNRIGWYFFAGWLLFSVVVVVPGVRYLCKVADEHEMVRWQQVKKQLEAGGSYQMTTKGGTRVYSLTSEGELAWRWKP